MRERLLGLVVCAAAVLCQQYVHHQHLQSHDSIRHGHPVDGFPVEKQDVIAGACPDFGLYSTDVHGPLSNGSLGLPYQRPAFNCRTFTSQAVEDVLADILSRFRDPDLARLFENCFPNTLDTTIKWHDDNATDPQTFVVTGDIDAEWVRDSYRQLRQYIPIANKDLALKTLLRGAINTQARFLILYPYCNAFNPPIASRLKPASNGRQDSVSPAYDPDVVFECKYELDSVATFFAFANDYYASTKDLSFLTSVWLEAAHKLHGLILDQMVPTYSDTGSGSTRVNAASYMFRRWTDSGTESLAWAGTGNPVAAGTGLVRSAFRPSDDSSVFQFLIPSNAYLSVQLAQIASVMQSVDAAKDLATKFADLAQGIRAGILTYGVYNHRRFGHMFAYEIDGFGSSLIMDDPNVPSLLSMPEYGFINRSDPLYRATRDFIFSYDNPCYMRGPKFTGIGGPHIGYNYAWPMSQLIRIRTTDDDEEIMQSLRSVMSTTDGLGLIHESVSVTNADPKFTRSWFAWANSEMALTVLDLAQRKPHLIFSNASQNWAYGS